MVTEQIPPVPLGAIEQYLREVNAIPQLTEMEETQLLLHIEHMKQCSDSRVIQQARQARDRLIEGYQSLVIGIAKRYVRLCRELELLDLVQEGNLGLLQAIEKYDCRLEQASFRTWAFSWVRGMMFTCLWRYEGALRLPLNAVRFIQRMEHVKDRLLSILRREPTIAEIASVLCVAERDVREMVVLQAQRVVSLHTLPAGDDTDMLEEYIADVAETSRCVDDALPALADALVMLSERERKVLSLRYGLEDGQARTHREVASLLGVALSTVAALDRRAQLRLRKMLASA